MLSTKMSNSLAGYCFYLLPLSFLAICWGGRATSPHQLVSKNTWEGSSFFQKSAPPSSPYVAEKKKKIPPKAEEKRGKNSFAGRQKEKDEKVKNQLVSLSRGRETRTPDLYVPNVARYRTALCPEYNAKLYMFS